MKITIEGEILEDMLVEKEDKKRFEKQEEKKRNPYINRQQRSSVTQRTEIGKNSMIGFKENNVEMIDSLEHIQAPSYQTSQLVS